MILVVDTQDSKVTSYDSVAHFDQRPITIRGTDGMYYSIAGIRLPLASSYSSLFVSSANSNPLASMDIGGGTIRVHFLKECGWEVATMKATQGELNESLKRLSYKRSKK